MKIIFILIFGLTIYNSFCEFIIPDFIQKINEINVELKTQRPEVYLNFDEDRKTFDEVLLDIKALEQAKMRLVNIEIPENTDPFFVDIYNERLRLYNILLYKWNFAVGNFVKSLEYYEIDKKEYPDSGFHHFDSYICNLILGEYSIQAIEKLFYKYEDDLLIYSDYLYLAFAYLYVQDFTKMNELLDDGNQNEEFKINQNLYKSHQAIIEGRFLNAIEYWDNIGDYINLNSGATWDQLTILEIEMLFNELVKSENDLLVGIFLDFTGESQRGVEYFKEYLDLNGISGKDLISNTIRDKYTIKVCHLILEYYDKVIKK